VHHAPLLQYLRWVPGLLGRWQHPDVHRLLATVTRVAARRGSVSTTRLHSVTFGGGLVILVLGLLGWLLLGGPSRVQDVLIVLDLTVGGTILLTGSLVGRARSGQARREAQLRVLQHTARRMSASLTREDVGRAVVEETRRVIDYHNARVYVLEPPNQLVAIAFEGRVGAYEKVDLEILRTSVGEGLTGWVGLHRTPLSVGNVIADPRGLTIPGTDEVDESMLVVPMVHDEDLIGVITLSKLGLHQFDEDDLQLLTILADQAATAFAEADLMAETARLTAELRQLLDMSSALSRTLDPRAVADLMAAHLAEAVGADQAQISDWDRANDRLRTLGCYPVATRAEMDDFYPLGDYPVTRRVLEAGVIEVVDADSPDADEAEARLLRHDGMRGLVMLPLVVNDEAIGLVELVSAGRPTSDPGRITLARTMAHEAAMALENARMYETARNLADRDPLTGFYNHRYLQQRLAEEVVRAVRTRQPVSVVMLDLDDFKLVNDSFGHLYGDGVLVHVAARVRSVLRASDIAARYGGDEFALILPDTDRDAATQATERLLAAFRESPFAADGRQAFPVGASIGISTHPADGRSATDLIAAADQRLYAAKNAGGNRIGPLEAVAREPGSPGRRALGVRPQEAVLTARLAAEAHRPSSPVGSGEA
jgi:diguanylate cyclase (GGDEF)-like protein